MTLTPLLAISVQALVSLSDEVEQARAQIGQIDDAAQCTRLMQGYFDDLSTLRPQDVDEQDVAQRGASTVQALFDARREAQGMLRALHDRGALTSECVTAVRRADLASRYLADHLIEALPEHARPAPWIVATGASPRDVVDSLQPGDVLVTRGLALSSAGIAHMGQIDSQFSHNALVWVDEDGEAFTVEAIVQRGAFVRPLERFLDDHLGRVVVLRHRDSALAARAASAAFERVSKGPKIHYDSAFESDDDTRLSCSEIPRWAFGSLTGEPTTVPLDLTRFPQRTNPALLRALGVEVPSTSAPADMLYDPRFEVVAEWRDQSAIGTMRRHDAVIESAMGWMEHHGYDLDPRFADRATADIGRALRGTPLLGAAFRRTLSRGLERQFLVGSLALQAAAIDIDDALAAHVGPGPTTRQQLLAELEALRQADLERWEHKPRSSVFHRRLHPGHTTER